MVISTEISPDNRRIIQKRRAVDRRSDHRTDEIHRRSCYKQHLMVWLCEHDLASLRQWLLERGHKPTHAIKILRHFYGTAGLEMFGRDIPKALHSELSSMAELQTRIGHRHVSRDGTIKLLLELADGKTIESVLMPQHREDRAAVCLSTQVGCAMGCDFCASTRNGLMRNLGIGEIVEQYIHLMRQAKQMNRRITSMVFMGMGEPLHNLDALIPAIQRIADPDMGGLGWRQITVSTVGIVPGIERLAQADLNIHLALSLHAADDATRNRIVPVNRKYPIAQIISAARRFHEMTGRIVTIEWCFLDAINDTPEQAELLAGLLKDFRAHVNVIPWNFIGSGISGVEYRKPSKERMDAFVQTLMRHGITVHARSVRGDDIAAACGQLVSQIK